jgi:Zn-dependent peptidase ImmA (M78 family)
LMHLRLFLEGVDFQPTSDVPSLDIEQYGTPEKIAGVVRAHWGVSSGSIKNLTALAERAGVIVGWSRFKGASVSGVTFRVPGRPPLVLLNAMHPADRMRFTLAHEIGHLVMHRFPTPNMETEANLFAAALLMPAADIRPLLTARSLTLAVLASLKPEWKVAMQALLVRAETLGVVTRNQSKYLWQQISARGWRLREPPELDFAHEEPRVLQSILKTHLSHLEYSVEDLANMVRIHQPEFTELYGALDQATAERPRLRIVT